MQMSKTHASAVDIDALIAQSELKRSLQATPLLKPQPRDVGRRTQALENAIVARRALIDRARAAQDQQSWRFQQDQQDSQDQQGGQAQQLRETQQTQQAQQAQLSTQDRQGQPEQINRPNRPNKLNEQNNQNKQARPRRAHCAINYFDNSVLTNTDVLHEERRRAARFAHIGDYRRHLPDMSRELQINSAEVVFTAYSPHCEMKQFVTITNPTAQKRRFQLLPPKTPFAVTDVAGCLAPGQSFDVAVYFRPFSYGFYSAEIEVRSGDQLQKVTLIARNLPCQFQIERIIVDDIEVAAAIERQQNDFVTQFDIDIGNINKSYSRPHTCKIFIANNSQFDKAELEKYFGNAVTSKYQQNTTAQAVDNGVHIIGIDVQSATGQKNLAVYISKEQFMQCDFFDADEQTGEGQEVYCSDGATALQEYLQFERDIFQIGGKNQTKLLQTTQQARVTQQAHYDSQPHYQVHVKKNGLFCLELDFGDDLTRENMHQLFIDTLEEYVLKINFLCQVVDGSVTVWRVGQETLTRPICAFVDLNNQHFQDIYETKQLPPERMFALQANIDCEGQDQAVKKQISLKIDGIDARKLKMSLRSFEEHLVLGYLSPATEAFFSENFALSAEVFEYNTPNQVIDVVFAHARPQPAVQLQSSLSQYLHRQQLVKPGPKRALLDISFVNESTEFTLFRAILTCAPVLKSYSHMLLKEHNIGIKTAITQLQRSVQPQTDYLLISEPAVDLGVIPVQTGAEFSFQIKNCSKTCYIPYIVSTNLHCFTTSLVTVPSDFGVKFKWTKQSDVGGGLGNVSGAADGDSDVDGPSTGAPHGENSQHAENSENGRPQPSGQKNTKYEVLESEVLFPDVCQVFQRSFVESLFRNLNRNMPQNYQPQYLKQLQSEAAKKPDSRDARRQMMHLNLPKSSSPAQQSSPAALPAQDIEPVIAYPHAGILPPQTSTTINIKVRPLSLGSIEAFIVINTPSAVYYEQTLKAIHARVQETQLRDVRLAESRSSSLSGLNRTHSKITTPLGQIAQGSQGGKRSRQGSRLQNIPDYGANYPEQSMKLFDQLREKAIPISEMQRLFQGQQQQSLSMEGGFLSERDVCCRVYGIVAATEVEFAQPEFSPANDQLQPVRVDVANKGRTSADVLLEIISGDASFVKEKDLPTGLEPCALQLWLGKQKQKTAETLQIDVNKTNYALIIPGLQDSVAVIKKPLSAFGIMASSLDQRLVDVNQNIVISACRIRKRLEPLRPYVYIPFFDQSFEILHNNMVLLPDMRISARPYNPIIADFIVVNPASSSFDCEITLGQDLIAPQLVKIPAQSKAHAQFALNPDRSGDIESFIQIHDAQMRLFVVSFGPDVSIRCPFLQQYNNLYIKQGMVDIKSSQGTANSSYGMEEALTQKPVGGAAKRDEAKSSDCPTATQPDASVAGPSTEFTEHQDTLNTHGSSGSDSAQNTGKLNPQSSGTANQQKQSLARSQNGVPQQAAQSWEKLIEQIPRQYKILPIEARDLNITIQNGRQLNGRPAYEHRQLDLTQLQNNSLFQQIIDEMPYLELKNQGGTQSSSINVTVFNPTGSSMKIQPKIIPLTFDFVKLRVECTKNSAAGDCRRSLVVGGLFSSSGTIDSPYFVATPQEAEIQSLKQTEIALKATNMKRLGKYEGVLQLSGIHVRLFCERRAPSVKLGDCVTQIQITADYASGATVTLPVQNQCQAKLSITTKIASPLAATPDRFELQPLGNTDLKLELSREQIQRYYNIQPISKNPTLADLIRAEKQQKTLSGALEIDIMSSENVYTQKYQLIVNIDAPLLLPRQRYVKFAPTFARKEKLQFTRLENQSSIRANYSIVNVPLHDAVALRLQELEHLESVEDYQQSQEEKYVRGVLDAAKITFTDFEPLFYDIQQKCIVIDEPALFQFNVLRGAIEGHGNERPFKYQEFGVRFQPDEHSFDKTRDRITPCKYLSVFYVAAQGGTGAFIVCEGSVNHNVDDI